VGEWVNVMGYIESIDQVCSMRSFDSNVGVAIQAIVLWTSGPIHLDLYERSLANHDQEVSNEKKA
jgi:hypothetical protein